MTPEWRRRWRSGAADPCALRAGRAVCDGVGGRLRWELRLTWLGGPRILDQLEAAGFDVFTIAGHAGRARRAWLVWQALRWRDRPAGGLRSDA